MAAEPEANPPTGPLDGFTRWFARWFELKGFAKWVALSGALGVAGGLIAAGFSLLVETCKEEGFGRVAGTLQGGIAEGADLTMVLLLPALGGLAVGLLFQRAGTERDGVGTDPVVRSFHRLKGRMRRRVISVTTAASALTIGSGGSGGQEGPICQVGAALGSNVASRFNVSDRDRRIFMMAGGSAGISALFGSPLGAALFMPEVMYRRAEFEGDAIIPCVVSSTVAYSVFTAVLGDERAIAVPDVIGRGLRFGGLAEIGIYVALGVICALLGAAFVVGLRGTERSFQRLRVIPRVLHPAMGGLIVGAMALTVGALAEGPGVAFGGYSLIEGAIGGTLALSTLGGMVLAKALATAATVGSGGAGGVFAPSLAIGAVLGAFVGAAAARVFPGLELQPAAFALVGMGGFFAGVAKVPIAAVVMVSEMTGNYALLAPLMIVAVVHMTLSTRWSMYPAQVGGPVDSPAHTGDLIVDVLQSLTVRDVLPEASEPTLIRQTTTLRGAMRIVSDSRDTHFPVVDAEGALVGIFSLSDLRRIYLEHEVEDMVIARDFMREQVATVTPGDSLHDVQRLFTRRAVSALPVVAEDDPRRVVALLRRNEIGRAYTERLRELKGGIEG